MYRSNTKLYVHCIWSTWDRLPLLQPHIEARLYASIAAKCFELKCKIIAIGGYRDHVHLLVRLPSTLSVAMLVQEVKGASSQGASSH